MVLSCSGSARDSRCTELVEREVRLVADPIIASDLTTDGAVH